MEGDGIHEKKDYLGQDFVGLYQFTTMGFSSEPNEICKSFTSLVFIVSENYTVINRVDPDVT